MRIFVLLALVCLPVSAGQIWSSADLGLEITLPDDWTVTDGTGYKEYGVPLLDPGPRIVMLAQAPTAVGELADGILQCVHVEVCEDTFGSYGALSSTLADNSRDLAFIGAGMPRIKDCRIEDSQLGSLRSVRCSVLAYKGGSYLNHIFHAVRLSDKRVVFINCYWRDDGMRAFASEFDPILASVKCSKAVAPVKVVAIGVGIGVGILFLALVVLVVRARKAAEVPPSPRPFPFPDAPPSPPTPQTP